MSAPDRNAHNWLIPVLAARGQYEAIEAIQDCWAEIERLRATAPTPDRIEAAARLLAKWIGYSWERGCPSWTSAPSSRIGLTTASAPLPCRAAALRSGASPRRC